MSVLNRVHASRKPCLARAYVARHRRRLERELLPACLGLAVQQESAVLNTTGWVLLFARPRLLKRIVGAFVGTDET